MKRGFDAFTRKAAKMTLLSWWLWCYRVAAWACFVTFHAVHAAEGNRARISEDAVDDADGFAIHRTFFIDGGSAFSEDSGHANDGKEQGRNESFHGLGLVSRSSS